MNNFMYTSVIYRLKQGKIIILVSKGFILKQWCVYVYSVKAVYQRTTKSIITNSSFKQLFDSFCVWNNLHVKAGEKLQFLFRNTTY